MVKGGDPGRDRKSGQKGMNDRGVDENEGKKKGEKKKKGRRGAE